MVKGLFALDNLGGFSNFFTLSLSFSVYIITIIMGDHQHYCNLSSGRRTVYIHLIHSQRLPIQIMKALATPKFCTLCTGLCTGQYIPAFLVYAVYIIKNPIWEQIVHNSHRSVFGVKCPRSHRSKELCPIGVFPTKGRFSHRSAPRLFPLPRKIHRLSRNSSFFLLFFPIREFLFHFSYSFFKKTLDYLLLFDIIDNR